MMGRVVAMGRVVVMGRVVAMGRVVMRSCGLPPPGPNCAATDSCHIQYLVQPHSRTHPHNNKPHWCFHGGGGHDFS